jgi:hypothetical protein
MARRPRYRASSGTGRSAHRGLTVELPAELTLAMRREWKRIDPWASDAQMEAIWTALMRHGVRPARRRDGENEH